MKNTLLAGAIATFLHTTALAESHTLEEMTIVGSQEEARQLAGSGSVIDSEQIRIEAADDINKLLKTVPGVYVQEEDGYGLRPNIGIRGATSERSSKITLLEDGIMMAPAPYSNPAAYYFPTTLRMHKIEVLKGAPLLRYGPQTTGGVVNMISTPIPDDNSGRVNASYGENSQMDLLMNYGGHSGNFGYLLETAQRRSNGFKDIDRSGHDTGFEIGDYLIKLDWEGERQSVLLKAQYSEENSDETYLGLTDADFNKDATRRYGLSRPDKMNNDHTGYSAVYRFAFTEQVRMTTSAYYNKFSRDWFKLSGGNAFITAANSGDAFAQGVLDGTQDIDDLVYRHNNRDYESKGLELNFDILLADHEVEVGGRVHRDEMDRLQPDVIYQQVNGELIETGTVDPVASNNREERADAYTFWLMDRWQLTDALNLNLVLRYEDVDSKRKEYDDPGRDVLRSRRKNNSNEWLPGASFTYDVSDSWQLLAGVHKGFSPLGGGASENEEPETSVNYEAGVRYKGDVFVEAIAFYSDFDNKSENCSNASPCSNGETSGSFNTGSAEIYGLELQVGSSMQLGNVSVPVDLMYTYTHATVSDDNPDLNLVSGDELAVIPENTFSLRVGLETTIDWNNYAVARYTDKMCMNVGCNNGGTRYDRSEAIFVVDYISRYALNTQTVVFLKVENIFDEVRIVSRQPDGARPNKPRTASVGVEWAF